MKSKRKAQAAVVLFVVAVAFSIIWATRPTPEVVSDAAPTVIDHGDPLQPVSTMADVLDMANGALQSFVADVDDYTATFVKQSQDASGVLQPEQTMLMKVQTSHRSGEPGSAKRVYLKFLAPGGVKGREVIWAEDLHDGKLLVREAGYLGLIPIPPLDPEGMLAMQGQKYPISQIGQTRLLELLVQRGEVDRDDPDVTVTVRHGVALGDQQTTLIQVRRAKPKGGDDDFSLAEISIDPERQLLLRYRSFGWPKQQDGSGQRELLLDELDASELPLLESYTYQDIKLNVGLSDLDFDPKNPNYTFP